MKHWISSYLCLTVVLSLLSGCSASDLNRDSESAEKIAGGKIFYATIEGDENATKVYLDEQIRMRWNSGDLITLFEGTTRNDAYRFDGEDGENSVEFNPYYVGEESGMDLDRYYALYPYEYTTEYVIGSGEDENDFIGYKLLDTQEYKERSVAPKANVMVAVTADLDDVDLRFRNVCSYLCVKLYGADQKVGSVVFQGNNGEAISGYAAITPVYGGAPSISVKGTGTTITLNCGDGVTVGSTKENATEFWIVVPPLTYSKGYKVTVNGYYGGSRSFEITASRTFERNKYNTLTRELVLDDGIDLTQYTDLSAEGTANCYMISEAGNYKFKAVEGNSDVAIENVKGAEVLWESFGTNVTPLVGDLVATAGYKNGYVYFSTPETFSNGNASVALRHSNGLILWSWHIWCTEEGWNDQVYPNNAGTMMDRNLGATSATPGSVGAIGLLYQWGRKDPFLGSSSISTGTDAAFTGEWKTILGPKSVEYAVQNPEIFITSKVREWCEGSTAEQRWMDSKKTKYDPCPAGYRVPKGGEDGFWAVAYENATFQVDETNYGVLWSLGDGVTAWYPGGGARIYNTGKFYTSGRNSYSWSSTSKNDGISYACLNTISSEIPLTASGCCKAYGISVRCVRE